MRVAGTGIAAHHFGPAAAEGFFHEFSGWLVFVVAFLMMLGLQRLLVRAVPPPRPTSRLREHINNAAPCELSFSSASPRERFRDRLRPTGRRRPVARLPFSQFPMQIDEWHGVPQPPIEARRSWRCSAWTITSRGRISPPIGSCCVGLYIGYYGSQRQGDTMHSPLNCLPGAGWEPLSNTTIPIPGRRGY